MALAFPYTITNTSGGVEFYIDKTTNVYSYIGLTQLQINFTNTIPSTGSNDRFTNNQGFTKFFIKTTLFGDGTNPVYINFQDTIGFDANWSIFTSSFAKNWLYTGSGSPVNAFETAYLFRTLPGGSNITFEIVRCTAATDPTTFDYITSMTYNTIHTSQETVGNLSLPANSLFRLNDGGISPFPIRLTASGDLTGYDINFTTYFNTDYPGQNTLTLNYTFDAAATSTETTTVYTSGVATGSFNSPSNNILFTFSSPAGGVNCLAYGTKVLTPFGYKLVQDIVKGELLTTHDGRITKVNKVLSRTIISTDELYLIKKESFGINIPNEDLYLSQSHAVYYNGAFHHPIHANNENIIKVDKTCFVQFYHFEVDNYFTDFIIANNMIVETNNSNSELNKICNYECTPGKCSIKMFDKDILPNNNEWIQLL
jgi:hypothetical protein